MEPLVEFESEAKAKSRDAFVREYMNKCARAGFEVPKRTAIKEWHRTRRWKHYRNDKYVVILDPDVDDMACPDENWIRVMHLSIRTVDRSHLMDWRDLQQIKTQLCGPHYEGMMLYPDEDRLVDCSNQFHILVPVTKDKGEPVQIPFGWMAQRKTATATDAAAIGAVQRE